jgi:hypothetical protein
MIAVAAETVAACDPTAAVASAIAHANTSCVARSVRRSSTVRSSVLRTSAAPSRSSAKNVPTVTIVVPNATFPSAVGVSRCASTNVPMNATT